MKIQTYNAIVELINSAEEIIRTINILWLANNPNEASELDLILTVDDAEELHSNALHRLLEAKYYANKYLQREGVDEQPIEDRNNIWINMDEKFKDEFKGI